MFDVIAVTEPALIDAVFEGIAPENQPDLAALINAPHLREWQLVDAATQQRVIKYCEKMGHRPQFAAGEQLTNTLYNLAVVAQQAVTLPPLSSPSPENAIASDKPLYLGLVSKIGYDAHGKHYAQQLHNVGIDLSYTPFAAGDTGLCASLQFSEGPLPKAMFTRLSSFQTLQHRSIQQLEAICAHTRYLLIEGYLMGSESNATHQVLQIARYAQSHHNPQLRIGLTLSAQKVANAFDWAWVRDHFDLIAANEEEYNALLSRQVSFDELHDLIDPQRKKILLYTQGKHGAILTRKDEIAHISPPNIAPQEVIDVTGAGDAFLAGVLYGLLQNMPLHTCGNIGTAIAACIVQMRGARL
ncbi:MAG: hypothetical protein IT273_02900 [Chitinophagales bacterium]|nr:hypothetical protein [Chitinophagales bacterium]